MVRTMCRALVDGDDSIFARCIDPQAEWIHPMVARLSEQPTPIFAELYKLLSWAAMLLSHVYSPPFRLEMGISVQRRLNQTRNGCTRITNSCLSL